MDEIEDVAPTTGSERRAQTVLALTRLGNNPVVPSGVSQKREPEQTGNQMDDLAIGLVSVGMLKMTAIPKRLVKIATRVLGFLEEDHGSECLDKKVAMTKVVEFYIPKNFRRPMKWVPELDRGKVLAFCPQTKKSA